MLAKLFLLFTLIPILELFVLIPLASQIGVLPTLAIIVATGLAGAVLGRRQGLEAWRRIQTDLAAGQLPGDAMMDGVLILVACTLLVTPGVLTDIVGISLLIPPARLPVKALLRRRFTNMLQNDGMTVIDVFPRGPSRERRFDGPDVIDITPSKESSTSSAS